MDKTVIGPITELIMGLIVGMENPRVLDDTIATKRSGGIGDILREETVK